MTDDLSSTRIIRTKQFADESVTRTRHPLTVPGVNIIEAFTTGAELITDDGNVVCQGQAVIVNGKSVQRAVTSAVYIVTIKEEEFSLDTVTRTLFAEARRLILQLFPRLIKLGITLHLNL